ncbi:ATPase [Myxococcota bacterium]|nr:ATPase [Myxococcota bacterium]MBU1381891.1 ATPase [Myxococcota bacterium]MBU1497792.1 ATPase [Myxococcota bacterium]
MAVRGIREYDGKMLMSSLMGRFSNNTISVRGDFALIDPTTDMDSLPQSMPWLLTDKLVAKPDMLFGKRGKNNLLKLNATWEEAKAWIQEKMTVDTTLSGVTGKLTHFLVEPFIPHDKEYYIAMRSFRNEDTLYFSTEGGINVEENWDKVKEIHVPVMRDGNILDAGNFDVTRELPLEGSELSAVASFVNALYRFYADQGFSYLEINPFAIKDNVVIPLDLVAKIDDTAAFENLDSWGRSLEFPSGFGKTPTKEEAFIKELDSKTGASLKLTVLNPDGHIWPMIAGGGASVIYADTVADLGYMNELGMYGEYSGDPNEELTYQYACTVIDLMTRKSDVRGKALLIGGGIANFTDVAKTFTGIIRAIEKYQDALRTAKVKIFVRRGGPNYKVGLDKMRALGGKLGIPIEVYGPETHMTRIVPMAIDYIKA